MKETEPALLKLVDTHCHLSDEQILPHAAQVVQRAQEAGVCALMNIACDQESSQVVCAQLQQFPQTYGVLGVHPQQAPGFYGGGTFAQSTFFEQALQHTPRVVAVGEIGLDSTYETSPMDQQIACFEYFLELALRLNLPVVVHVRKAHEAVLHRLQGFSKRGGRGVIHCFTGTKDEARDFLNCGFFLSFSGIVTFKNAKDLHESAIYVPAERMLIETDSPYLAPVPFRGKTNEPAWVAHVCQGLAQLRGQSAAEIAQITTRNAFELFLGKGIPPHE